MEKKHTHKNLTSKQQNKNQIHNFFAVSISLEEGSLANSTYWLSTNFSLQMGNSYSHK